MKNLDGFFVVVLVNSVVCFSSQRQRNGVSVDAVESRYSILTKDMDHYFSVTFWLSLLHWKETELKGMTKHNKRIVASILRNVRYEFSLQLAM